MLSTAHCSAMVRQCSRMTLTWENIRKEISVLHGTNFQSGAKIHWHHHGDGSATVWNTFKKRRCSYIREMCIMLRCGLGTWDGMSHNNKQVKTLASKQEDSSAKCLWHKNRWSFFSSAPIHLVMYSTFFPFAVDFSNFSLTHSLPALPSLFQSLIQLTFAHFNVFQFSSDPCFPFINIDSKCRREFSCD